MLWALKFLPSLAVAPPFCSCILVEVNHCEFVKALTCIDRPFVRHSFSADLDAAQIDLTTSATPTALFAEKISSEERLIIGLDCLRQSLELRVRFQLCFCCIRGALTSGKSLQPSTLLPRIRRTRSAAYQGVFGHRLTLHDPQRRKPVRHRTSIRHPPAHRSTV